MEKVVEEEAMCEIRLVAVNSNNHQQNVCTKIIKEDSLNEHSSVSFKNKDIVLKIIATILYLSDFGTDIWVACEHHKNRNFGYFWWTVTFIVFPSLLVSTFGYRWYKNDYETEGAPEVCRKQRILRNIFIFLQLGPLFRYMEAFYYGMKTRNNNNTEEKLHFFKLMAYENNDVALLRLFECFMESAPQLILQGYILMQRHTITDGSGWTAFILIISLAFSFISISRSLVTFNGAMRFASQSKKNLTLLSSTIQCLWYVLQIFSRIGVVILFASVFPLILGIIILLKYFIMLGWIFTMETDFIDNRFDEYMYRAAFAVVYIVCYFNVEEGPSFWKHTFHYIITVVENIIYVTCWYIFCPPEQTFASHKLSVLLVLISSSALSFGIMIAYYKLFHPNMGIVTKSSWVEDKPTVGESSVENTMC